MKNLSESSSSKVSVEATDKKTWQTPEVIDFAVDMTESKPITDTIEMDPDFGAS